MASDERRSCHPVVKVPADLALKAERATPLAMFVNEAVCNSIKHEFNDRLSAAIDVLVSEVEWRLSLVARDDGSGRPASAAQRRHSVAGEGTAGATRVSGLNPRRIRCGCRRKAEGGRRKVAGGR